MLLLIVDQPGRIAQQTATANFLGFLQRLGVRTEKTDLTFALSRDYGRFEWSNASLQSLFCRRRNIFSLRNWRTLFDVLRFNQFALDVLIREEGGESKHRRYGSTDTIGEYLQEEGYSETFRDDYLIPLTATLWSMSRDKCALEFPIATLVRFM